MNSDLIQRWNTLIAPQDEVWHLGDAFFRGSEQIFYHLNGRKHLIIGNHDSPTALRLPWTSEPKSYHELKLDGKRLILCHYPLRSWHGAHKGTLHLYGHVHGRLGGSQQCLDVGVDAWNFMPVTLPQIRERLAGLPAWSEV